MGLLVFGGSDPVTNQDGYENAFDAGFCERKKAMWQVILDSKDDPPAFEEWTEVDEAKLEKLKSIDNDMNDTSIGRAKTLTQRSMANQFENMPKEARQAYLKQLQDSHDTIEAQSSGANSES